MSVGTDKFIRVEKNLRCPVCGKAMASSNASLVCENNHCFDIAKKGYVNFAPQKKFRGYDASLFESRQRAFRAGFYDHILHAVSEAALRNIKSFAPLILDAGCGEGYYALGMKEFSGPCANVIGLDIEKDAIQIAARGGNDVIWLVGDLANIPLKDNCSDVVLNIFSPAGYAEFTRIVKPDGIVLKVIPGESYLQEIRQAAKEELHSNAYSPTRVTEHLKEHLSVVEKIHIVHTLPVSREQLNDFLNLTPMLFHVDTTRLTVEHIREVTIDAEIYVAKPR
ncbi:MAG TPA: methyltransferase domain-containing protein [Clostridia bacterium]|nr:methyltransferase domain-containing protein [Clostridia bacterium]